LNDCKRAGSKSDADRELWLDKDIYIFFLLIRQTDHYMQWSCLQRFKLQAISFFCFFVQFFTVICLIFNDYNSADTNEITIDCAGDSDTPALYVEYCTFVEDIYEQVYYESLGFLGYLERICAIGLVACYLYPNVTSFARYAAKWLQTRQLQWFAISAFQFSIILIVGLYVTQMIYKSQSTLDVLSAGIGFIILLEVDSFLYNVAYGSVYARAESQLFKIELNQNEVQRTIFKFVDPETYDLIIFSCIFWVQVFPAMMASSWHAMGLDRKDPGDEIIFDYVVMPIAFILPCFFVWWPFLTVLHFLRFRAFGERCAQRCQR